MLGLIVLVVILGGARYLSQKQAYQQAYTHQYEQCMQRYVDRYEESGSQATTTPQNSQMRDCLNKGGCYDACGGACAARDPHLSVKEWLSGTMRPRECIEVCVAVCIMPPQSFQ